MLGSAILAGVLGLLLIFQTLASDVKLSFPEYQFVDVSWSLEVFPGQYITLNGTIQEAVAQAVQINPEYEMKNSTTASRDVSTLQKRKYTNWEGNPECNPPGHPEWGYASTDWIRDGVRYLDRINDGTKPSLGAGPGKCERVSCAWSSAIYWCNDKRVGQQLRRWGDIADGAQRMLDFCTGILGDVVKGQQFTNEKWNVIVWGERC